jgi:hypothetical protein
MYDVACQYTVNIASRFEKYLPERGLGPVIQRLTPLVPKLHLDGHKDDCKYRFSLNYEPGSGRTDGEGIERSWPEIKQAGAHTSECNNGHRKEILTDYNNDYNFRKNQGMGMFCITDITSI